MVHVHPDLVRPSGFQFALNHGHVTEALQYPVVGDGMLAGTSVREYFEALTVVRIPSDVADHCSAIFLDIAPDDGYVFPVNGVVEELFLGENLLCLCTTSTCLFIHKQLISFMIVLIKQWHKV